MRITLRASSLAIGVLACLLGGWLIAVAPGLILPIAPPLAALAIVLSIAVRWYALPRLAPVAPSDGSTSPTAPAPSAPVMLYADADNATRQPLHVTIARGLFYCGLLTMSILAFRPLADLTFSDLLFLLSLAVFVMGQVLAGKPLRTDAPRWFFVGLAFYTFGAIISSSQAHHPLQSLIELVKFAFIVALWFGLATQLLDTPARVHRAVAFWVASVAANGAVALAQSRGIAVPGAVYDWGRYAGLADHVTDMGAMTSIALIPAFAMIALSRSTFARFVLWVPATALILAGLVLSGSVTGMAVIVPTVGLFAVLVGARFLRWGIGIILVALVLNLWLGFVSYTTTSIEERVAVTTTRDDGSASAWSRVATYRIAIDHISTSPFVGVGLDWESRVVIYDMTVHNVLLGAWYETGLFGLVGMTVILAAAAVTAVQNVKRSRAPALRTLAAALAAAVLAFLLFAQSGGFLYQRYGWVPVLLMMGLHASLASAAADRQPRDRSAPVDTPLAFPSIPMRSITRV